MKVVVIGAAGQLGSDLCAVLGERAVPLTHQQVDVNDPLGLLAVLRETRPDWVVNTAAFHRVDDCELDPGRAFRLNAVAPWNVARAAAEVGARTCFVSTDYVYGRDVPDPRRPWLESDPPAPVNVYGTSKVAGEDLVRQVQPEALVVRSAGLYGVRGSGKGWTFPQLMLHLAETRGAVRVVDDQVLSPTYTADLAAAIVSLMEDGAAGLFHVVNDGHCSWYEFAKRTFEIAEVEVDLAPQSTAEAGRRAARPPWSALASERLPRPLRPWQEALEEYLEKIGKVPAGRTR